MHRYTCIIYNHTSLLLRVTINSCDNTPGAGWSGPSTADILPADSQPEPRGWHQPLSGGHPGLHIWDSTPKNWRPCCGERIPSVCYWFFIWYVWHLVHNYTYMSFLTFYLYSNLEAYYFNFSAGSQMILNYTAQLRSHKRGVLDLPAFLTFSNLSQVVSSVPFLLQYRETDLLFHKWLWNNDNHTFFCHSFHRTMSACLAHWQLIWHCGLIPQTG